MGARPEDAAMMRELKRDHGELVTQVDWAARKRARHPCRDDV